MTSWTRAESSVPITHRAVIATMMIDGERGDRQLGAGEAVQAEKQVGVAGGHVGQGAHDQDAGHADGPAPDPTRHGPIARVTHENVVPQSWSARFM